MDFEFDLAKDAINRAKHGVSLAAVADFELMTFFEVKRNAYGEVRYIGYGILNQLPHVLVFTWPTAGIVRAISLRRSHLKEFRRNVES